MLMTWDCEIILTPMIATNMTQYSIPRAIIRSINAVPNVEASRHQENEKFERNSIDEVIYSGGGYKK